MERGGCYIASAELTPKYSESGEGGSIYHTFATYESRAGISRTIDLHNRTLHFNTTYRIIIAEPFIAQAIFLYWTIILSEELLQKMKHGLYTKGDLSNMENLQYDSNVRAAFEDYDKPRISDFFKKEAYSSAPARKSTSTAYKKISKSVKNTSAYTPQYKKTPHPGPAITILPLTTPSSSSCH